MKTIDQITEPAPVYQKHNDTETFTVQVRINYKKHNCPMCCLEFYNVSASHVEGEFTDGSVFNNDSIIPVKPVSCDCCGLKVIC